MLYILINIERISFNQAASLEEASATLEQIALNSEMLVDYINTDK